MTGNLKQLISSRANYRGQVNRIFGDISNFSGKTATERNALTSKLNRLQAELDKLDLEIRDLKWAANFLDEDLATSENNKEIEESTNYQDKISSCLFELSQIVSASQSLTTASTSGTHNSTAFSMLKSASAPLPKFTSAEGEDLVKFLHQFEETTKRFSYTDYDRFLLLKQQISGRALALIDSLDCAKHSYQSAKDLLLTALASTAQQKFNVIKQMVSLNLDYSSEPFEYIGKINSIHSSFKTLKISTDDILQYFSWKGLNESFKTQLVHITNNSKPSLEEIKDKFFEANERYLNVKSNFRSRQEKDPKVKENFSKSLSFAANINYRNASNVFKTCPLCPENASSHAINKCTKFADPKSKVDKLTSLRGCVKCARLDHRADSCKFHFYNQCSCGKWHFSFLCLKGKVATNTVPGVNPSSSKKSNSSGEAKVSVSGVLVNEEIITDSFKTTDFSQAVLPTFTCWQSGRFMHSMRDGGCQSNFILESRAIEDNLPIIESNVKSKICGFNSTKIYYTNIYKVDIKIGDKVYEIEAMGTPDIRVRLNLIGVSDLAKAFMEKGYNLADETLLDGRDNQGNIEFILGTNYAYCLLETLVKFGGGDNQSPSVYSQTPAGVMLLGNIDDMKANLKYLPVCQDALLVQSAELESSKKKILCNDLGFNVNSCLNVGFSSSTTTDNVVSETGVGMSILNDEGDIIESELQKASDEVLERICNNTLNYDREQFLDGFLDDIDNERIINYVLDNTTRNSEGRLIMPLIWNTKVDHLLGKNRNLALQILRSNFKKLSRDGMEKLKMIDQNFKEQRELGIIEKIGDLDKFLDENPRHSFLAHMAVFKPDRHTTKCRVVYLSNLSEKDPSRAVSLSHNQAMLSGPCLNQKITTALLHLRFDTKLLCFDIKKAFLNIGLTELDSNKLLFLWYNNVDKNDFSVVGYRSLRWPFGLVCSPCLLLLGLYRILMIDIEEDSRQMRELKRQIYSLMYMDNGSITSNDSQYLKWAFDNLSKIFEPYKFSLQQFVTNDDEIQAEIDQGSNDPISDEVKLLGLSWNRKKDCLSTRSIHLDTKANTKRTILKTIAAHFDVFGFTGPILNRARLFLHTLQCDKSLGWDTKLSEESIKEWKNISSQVNSSPNVQVKRFVGRRDGKFRLIAFTDSSKDIYGTVIFIQDLNNLEVSFVLAKNRLVNKQLSGKSIPSLEFQAISLGTDVLIDVYKELSGPTCVDPVQITELILFSDSMVSLAWINSYSHKLDKMNKHSVFIRNRLERLNKLCEIHPVTYKFVAGIDNPADLITRPVSYKLLMKSNYFTGPKFLKESLDSYASREDVYNIVVPNPVAKPSDPTSKEICHAFLSKSGRGESGHLVLMDKCSSFFRLVSIHKYIFKFIHKLKSRMFAKDPIKYSHWESLDGNSYHQAFLHLVKIEQHNQFPEIFSYFGNSNKAVKDIPNIVNQLNIYPDKHGVLRVKSKFSRWSDDVSFRFPILLPKNSLLTKLIILDFHERLMHAGCYRLLTELRKHFWVTHYFSVVKKTIKDCVTCKKLKQRSIKLNQSPYREFRLKPPNIPFRSIFIDNFGPYYISYGGKKVKIWILCITCLWSRGINLKICWDMSTKEFIRALQLHCLEYGLPELCLSDLGSNFIAGANVISDFLKGPDIQNYFQENGVKSISFEQYFKGHHPLGGIIEICVKMVKQLIHSSIRNYVLEYRDFEFIILQTVHLVNRRPVAFQEGLRDSSDEVIPDPITPERLIHGYELVSVNLIPELQPDPSPDPDWQINADPISTVKDSYQKLKNVRSKLIETYNNEFLGTLMKQATNIKDRYRPVTHKKLQIGDIVLIKEENCKPMNFPMAIVKRVTTNINNEVTGAVLQKGNKEIVKRHATSLIPILQSNCKPLSVDTSDDKENSSTSETVHQKSLSDKDSPTNNSKRRKRRRKAAIESRRKTKKLISDS